MRGVLACAHRFNSGFGALSVKLYSSEQYANIVKLATRIDKLGELVEAKPPLPELVALPKPQITVTTDDLTIELNGKCYPLQYFLMDKGFEKQDTYNHFLKVCKDKKEHDDMLAWLSGLGRVWGWSMEGI